jgi:hypothetical protein
MGFGVVLAAKRVFQPGLHWRPLTMHHTRTRISSLVCGVALLAACGVQGCGDGFGSLFGGGGSGGNGNTSPNPQYGQLGGSGSDGGGSGGSQPQACVNLCQKQIACPGGATTTLSGTIFSPAKQNPDPVYNAIVYVPNAQVQPFSAGVSCDQCGASVSGNPLVSALTGPDGKFTLGNVPVGTNIPLVVQIGRWRRQLTIPAITPCTDNPVDPATTRLPRNQTEGDIPLTAISTGQADALECVLRKMGVDDSEFTLPSASGRMRMFNQNGAVMPNIPDASTLWSDPNELAKYDIVILDCEGHQDDNIGNNKTAQQNVIDYTSKGGRVFASHYSYVWLYNDAPFSGTASWNVDQGHPMSPLTGIIDTSFPKGQAFLQWLGIVNALSGTNTIDIQQPRHDAEGVNPPSTRWIYSQSPNTLQHYTFNTPVGQDPTKQCGRVVFSDFHVTGANGTSGGAVFPAECDNGPMLPQEKVLEFMMFDLASCIQNDNQPPVPPPSGPNK